MTAADLSRLDTALPVLIARVDALAAQKRAHMATGLLAEDRHQCDPDDIRFARLPCPHPELCSTAADYPGFDAWIAQQQNLNTAARRNR
ncbi:hypothetical protein IX27_17955 [Streptomyces sp. JS01]|uniref:hypothetical protein n=1 Tax=Streptomyces sp. JS01 TaxID=1525753 RepID=UPI0005036F8A|nr:hypothetical protein [Streptomyces sp. JS01]KFK87786.1 hypothetical protein IX27_17955 [Streptomyces sp. JS01]